MLPVTRKRSVHPPRIFTSRAVRDRFVTGLCYALALKRFPGESRPLDPRQNISDSIERDIKLPRNTVALFTRQLSVMLDSAVPIRDSLGALVDTSDSEKAEIVISYLLNRVENGWPLSKALASFPKVFDRVFVAMVEVGEETGQLVETLGRLADWTESEENLSRTVRGAMVYPSVVASMAVLLFVGFFTIIFPGFVESLSVAGELPTLTRAMIMVSDTLRSPLFWTALAASGVLGYFALKRYLPGEKAQIRLWQVASMVPVLGPLVRDLAASRFCAAMSILLDSGVDILKAFRLASLASGSPLIIANTRAGVLFLSHGGDLDAHMFEHPELYPHLMSALVSVGQEAAQLPEMFSRINDTLQDFTETRLEVLTSLLEPVMMGFVAVLVSLFILGLAGPMYGMLNSL